ncbi:MAG: TssQ family T6SS-associated lipoprotein [Pseudomonadales bacterium]|jgi:outer membrane protein assembly factor BamD (BamD/ComL family)|nr:TssQ family T6SS-associated lipoprotein [Pseudomonadales bacterium]
MKIYIFAKSICIFGLMLILASCRTTLPSSSPASAPPTSAVERIFDEGMNLYSKGEYTEAIKRFQSIRYANTSSTDLRARALKQLAFSYCVTDDLRACQQAFYEAMQLNPKFRLLPSEEGHPIWGPVYQKAKYSFEQKRR